MPSMVGNSRKVHLQAGEGFRFALDWKMQDRTKVELFTKRRKNAKQIVEERLKLIAE